MNVTYIPIRICFEEPVEMNEGILMKLLKLGHIKNKQSSFLFETTYDWFVGFFSRKKTNDDVMFNTQIQKSKILSVLVERKYMEYRNYNVVFPQYLGLSQILKNHNNAIFNMQ